MPPARLVAGLALGLALLAARVTPAAVQAELQMWLNPEMGQQIPRADYRYNFYPERQVEDQETHFQMTEQRITLFTPLYQDPRDEWGFAAKTLYQDIDTHARFLKAGGVFPSELWDASAGLSYRHKFDNGWTGGLALTVGTASDVPFNSIDEMYFRLIALVRVPQGERNSWIFTLIYASDEEVFGQTLPVPGIAYAWNPSDKFQALIGFPFSMIRYKPIETVTLDAEYYPFWTARTRATWEIFSTAPRVRGISVGQRSLLSGRSWRQGRQDLLPRDAGLRRDPIRPAPHRRGSHRRLRVQSLLLRG
jgi:hypothetical protein